MFRAVILLAAIVYLTSTMAQFQAPQIPAHTQAQCVEKLCANNPGECSSRTQHRMIFDACSRQLDLGCLDLSMKLISSYEQNEIEEMVSIARSCQYVSGYAHQTAMKNMYRYDRDEFSEITFINSRLWLVQNSCLSSALSRLQPRDFDGLEDLKAITNQCTGTFDVACFETQCKSKYSCNDQEEVVDALRSCISGPSKVDRRRL
ncbi:hypothetical protein ABMA79_03210 [Halobacteriovorax sp. HFRX-2_2]|uniref:hypothetical protein n=1 Tax=unclassified Halobacteriovorax TaxID=2639665 RepID=UPI00371BF737